MFKPAQRSWSILELSYRAAGIVVEIMVEIVATEIMVEIVVEMATLDVTSQYEQKVRYKVCNPWVIL